MKESGYKQVLTQEEVTGEAIRCSLEVGVPFRMFDMQQHGGPSDRDWEETRAFAWVLGPSGDNLLYKSGKRGETARLMNEMIRAIAVLAFAPGGITIYGLHFDAGTPDSEGTVCCTTLRGMFAPRAT